MKSHQPDEILHPRLSTATKHIHFLLVLASQDETAQPEQTISQALDIAMAHDGMVESITGTLITILFGAPIKQPDAK